MQGREAGALAKGQRAGLLPGLPSLKRSGDYCSSRACTWQLQHIKYSAKTLQFSSTTFFFAMEQKKWTQYFGKRLEVFIHVSLVRCVIQQVFKSSTELFQERSFSCQQAVHDFQTSVKVFPVQFVESGKCHTAQGGGEDEDFSFGSQYFLTTYLQCVKNIDYLIIFCHVVNNLKGMQLVIIQKRILGSVVLQCNNS